MCINRTVLIEFISPSSGVNSSCSAPSPLHSSGSHALHSAALYAFSLDLCLPTVWWSNWEMLWHRRARSKLRLVGSVLPLLVLCLQKTQEDVFFPSCIEFPFGFRPWIRSLLSMKRNDTLIKVIIDWMCGCMGNDCPPVCRSGCSSSRGLNTIKPPGYYSQLFSPEPPTP